MLSNLIHFLVAVSYFSSRSNACWSKFFPKFCMIYILSRLFRKIPTITVAFSILFFVKQAYNESTQFQQLLLFSHFTFYKSQCVGQKGTKAPGRWFETGYKLYIFTFYVAMWVGNRVPKLHVSLNPGIGYFFTFYTPNCTKNLLISEKFWTFSPNLFRHNLLEKSSESTGSGSNSSSFFDLLYQKLDRNTLLYIKITAVL